MSVEPARARQRRHLTTDIDNPHRIAALVGVSLLTYVPLRELYAAAMIVGAETRLIVSVVMAFLAAAALARTVPVRVAAALAGGGVVVSLLAYLLLAPGGLGNLLGVFGIIRDTVALLSGITILSIVGLDLWVVAVAPAPVFLSWYLVWQERYVAGAGVGLALAVLLIATGDLHSLAAIVAVVAGGAVVGFGELHRRRAAGAEGDVLAVVLAVMLIASLAVPLVPGTGGQPLSPAGGVGGPQTTDSALIGGEEMSITGNPSLDPTVRFTVEAEEERNWRVDSFDRYTGDGWVQSGETEPFEQPDDPYGDDESTMAIEPETDAGSAVPARWQPVAVDGIDSPEQSPGDGIRVGGGLEPDARYEITSVFPNVTGDALDDPAPVPTEIEDRYTQLPETTPDRVGEFTETVIENDETDLERAASIEQFLIETYEYSLDVDAPEGDIADEQLFEREAGYCATFATTMAVMLRTQDVPARVVTGYSSGERVAEDRWVVRGMNAHAWVEVYVPEVGWVDFDPTPAGPYDEVRDEELEEAREDERDDVDTDETGGPEWTPEPDTDGSDGDELVADNETAGATNATMPGATPLEAACDDPDAVRTGQLTEVQAQGICSDEELDAMHGIEPGDFQTPGEQHPDPTATLPVPETVVDEEDTETDGLLPAWLPAAEQLALAMALVVAGVAGARHGGVTRRVRRVVNTRWQGRRGDPAGVAERAWYRVESHFSASDRPRRTGETVREYVARLDGIPGVPPEVGTVAEIYERARYAPEELTESEARRAVDAADDIVGRSVP